MAAMASVVRGMRVVCDKECVDPCKCHAVYCTAAHYGQRVPVTSFRTGINDDDGLWAGGKTAPARTPVQDGHDRRRAPEAAWAAKRSRGCRGDQRPPRRLRLAFDRAHAEGSPKSLVRGSGSFKARRKMEQISDGH